MRILVLEPFLTGHHGPYLQWITAALNNAGHGVTTALLRNHRSHPLFEPIASRCQSIVDIEPGELPQLGGSESRLRVMWSTMARYREVFGQVFDRVATVQPVDLVLLPYLDYCTYALAVQGAPFGETPWSAIAMRPAFHYARVGVRAPRGAADPLKAFLFRRLLSDRTLKVMFTIDESLATFFTRADRARSKLRLLRDPARGPALVANTSFTREPETPAGAFVVLVYGALSARKGIGQLLQGAAHVDCPRVVHVVLAGKQDEDVKRLMRSDAARALLETSRLHTLDRFVSDDEEDALLAGCDAIWAGYRGHYQMSASLVHAGLRGVPVIGCEEGLIEWLIRRTGGGVTVNIENSYAVAEALKRLSTQPELCSRLGENGRNAFGAHAISFAASAFVADLAA